MFYVRKVYFCARFLTGEKSLTKDSGSILLLKKRSVHVTISSESDSIICQVLSEERDDLCPVLIRIR